MIYNFFCNKVNRISYQDHLSCYVSYKFGIIE